MIGTFIKPILSGGKHIHADGLVHTTFNTTGTVTGRLSSDKPNVQNYPRRTAEQRRIREAFVAPPGHVFVKCDYGQMEARVIAMATKDQAMVAALYDRYDVHGAWAKKLDKRCPYVLPKHANDMKVLRGIVKNSLVFPAFYGASAKSIARNLGIDELECEDLFRDFWHEFRGVKRWQDREWNFFLRRGYVQTLFGRRRRGILSRNMVLNSPIQSAASDIVVRAMHRLSEKAIKDQKPCLQAVINIHDDLSFYVPENGIEEYIEDIVTEMLWDKYDFMNVPLSVEVSVGANWSEVQEVGSYFSNTWR